MTHGGQDFATFEAQNAGTADAAEPAVEAPADKPEEGAEAAEAPDEELVEHGDDGKPLSKTQQRFNEITRARREAERRADAAERDAKYLRDRLEGRAADPAPKVAEAPNPDDYDLGDLDPRYTKAVIAHEVKLGIAQGLDEIKGTVAEDRNRQAQERVWEAKFSSARSKFADFDAVIAPKDESGAIRWPLSDDAGKAIQESDVAGELLYHLASNPEEARRIYAMSPHSQIREIGRLEASLVSSEAPAPAKTTNAPKPATVQARGAGGHFAASAATTNFAEFEAMANRKT